MHRQRFFAVFLLVAMLEFASTAIAHTIPSSMKDAIAAHTFICDVIPSPRIFIWKKAKVSIEEAWVDDIREYVLSFRFYVQTTDKGVGTPDFQIEKGSRKLSIEKLRQLEKRCEGVVHIEPVVECPKTLSVQVAGQNITFDMTNLVNGNWSPEILSRMKQS